MRKSIFFRKIPLFALVLFISLHMGGCGFCHRFASGLGSIQVSQPPAEPAAQVPVSCPDVELLGLSSNNVLTAVNYFAQIRNKAPYAKNVTVEWTDKDGQAHRAACDIQAGQMTRLRLCTQEASERQPRDLNIVACY